MSAAEGDAPPVPEAFAEVATAPVTPEAPEPPAPERPDDAPSPDVPYEVDLPEPTDLSGTLGVLTAAIQRHPEAPSNYVVRGEFYLGRGEILAAAADFRRALQLAESGAAGAVWGYVYTALADRAREGLRRCGG